MTTGSITLFAFGIFVSVVVGETLGRATEYWIGGFVQGLGMILTILFTFGATEKRKMRRLLPIALFGGVAGSILSYLAHRWFDSF